jgi:hypothetical protein
VAKPPQASSRAGTGGAALARARAWRCPYPAYGSPQPQIQTRNAGSRRPAIDHAADQATAIAIARVPSLAAARSQVALEDASVALARDRAATERQHQRLGDALFYVKDSSGNAGLIADSTLLGSKQ